MDASAVLSPVDPQLGDSLENSILAEDDKEMGLPTNTDMPVEMYRVMDLFAQYL